MRKNETMAFLRHKQKIHLNDAHGICLNDTLNLSGGTFFGTNANMQLE